MSHLSDIKPGQIIGRYEFLAPIAQGGMAAVWGARLRGSRGFSKVVAIKTMLPSISDDPRFEKMFLAEAQIASRIRHGNVVEILDLGEENDILYLVMEWVDGESLSTLRRRAAERGGIPLRIAVRIVADVCAGLHAAHELVDDEGRPFGLVHRDVSPQNVLVGYDGNVKILDFGVAKVAGRTTDTTNIGHARGKPPYMAPEQALGKEIDRRADIFSLGIIFYQLLVGRHPFRGENDIATLHNIISDQSVESPRKIDGKVTEQVESIVLRALERDPHRRFQSAQEFELALEAVLDSELGRVRLEEIGRLMVDAFGAMREDRRCAIREAIRRADTSKAKPLEPVLTPPHVVPSSGQQQLLEENIETSTLGASVVADLQEVELSSSRSAAGDERAPGPYENSGADAVLRRRRGIPAAKSLMRVFVAMTVGAIMTWIWLTVVSRKTEPHVHVTPSSRAVPSKGTPSVRSSVTLPNASARTMVGGAGATTLQDPPTDGVKDSRGAGTSQRVVQPYKKSPNTAPRVRHSALPPVSSPGF